MDMIEELRMDREIRARYAHLEICPGCQGQGCDVEKDAQGRYPECDACDGAGVRRAAS